MYCADYHRDFICRSSGGGSANRKVCVPGGGGTFCNIADDCTADFPYRCEDAYDVLRCYNAGNTAGRTCLNSPN